MEHNSRMKEITGNLKQDVKDLLGESASLFTGFFKRGACTVRAVADKWKAFAHDISAAVDDLMKPPFAEGGPEAPMVSLDPEGEPIVTVMESMVVLTHQSGTKLMYRETNMHYFLVSGDRDWHPFDECMAHLLKDACGERAYCKEVPLKSPPPEPAKRPQHRKGGPVR